jgi:hypothetical protein
MKSKQFKYHWDDYAKTPYIVNGRQWLGVEDKRSVQVGFKNKKILLILGENFVGSKFGNSRCYGFCTRFG